MSTNYKETLNLPKTDFPMKADLVKREPERLAKWEAAGLYAHIQEARKDAELFVLHDGPPFANGDVHMGTALNKVLKDMVVKSRSMLGFRAPFVPGWDCHGLPIEFKVVKESRGLSPVEIRQKSEAYARKFIDIQRGQFKRLGVFGDWENPYLTLDPGYEAEIIRAFAGFVEKGLVYQSKKPVLWSTGAQTALAEAEVEYENRTDPAIYVKFPIVSGELAGKASMVIWTTTPWTLPANVAIAVFPHSQYVVGPFQNADGQIEQLVIVESAVEAFEKETGWRLISTDLHDNDAKVWHEARMKEGVNPSSMGFKKGPKLTCWVGTALTGEALSGTEAAHPFLDRTSRVISADFVTLDTGTGQVHIAPGHGKDDYLAGQQNGLPTLSPVDDFGRYVQFDSAYNQMPGRLDREGSGTNRFPSCKLRERCGYRGTAQAWALACSSLVGSRIPALLALEDADRLSRGRAVFIKIDAFRSEALAAIDSVEWLPAWGRNRIFGTVESRPDWCISRQRTWGVPLPVFYDADGKPLVDGAVARRVADLVEQHGTNLWFEKTDAEWAQMLDLPPGTTRRNDTLDVWIDSGVSHTAVTAKRPELGGGTVADVYLEATDQHRGWFQSSLMTSVALYGKAPYRTVITHGFVVDKDTRKKVSKSEQGTYAKPMNAEHFVGKYGADIVRLWAASVEFTNEVPFSEESFKGLSDAYRSFRNVLRILLANLPNDTEGRASARPLLSSDQERAGARPSGLDGATAIDRWMLSRLQEVIATCREAYTAYDFRKVFGTLNQFVTVDVSALYVDITKDRLYCDAPDSARRLATQTVIHQVFDALCRLLAPVLAFTADEAWEFAGKPGSVHLETFPTVDESLRDPALERLVEEWLKLRGVIAQQAVEPARQQKLIGNALEAAVTLEIADPALLADTQARAGELEEFFILSDLTVLSGPETRATLVKTEHSRCGRCWRHRSTVGLITAQPELCDRCASVVGT